ncbi:hypothetical protein BJ875DRAFT_450661 [Amylocarpus encephaloides]|uniref:Uncharacterized protein n=1 Tax=Amylocarpus encephaloides TaxID=45428 RepID=A0A9P8C9L3_9HELO|nr:hypothetical protein BJ875DRAFT_450661 [Amylocarpus encephaloides]
MGWFDGGSTLEDWAPGASSKHHRSHSRDKHHRSSSRHRSSGSIFGGGDHHKHNRSSASIFGIGDSHKHNSSKSSFFGGDSKKNRSTSSFFSGFGGERRSSSYYKRSPRDGFMKKAYRKLRRLLRDLIYYMKRNPMKVFMLVIMPLITGGALTGLLHKFGIRLPHVVEKMMGGPPGGNRGGQDGGMQYERTHISGQGSMGGMGGMGGAMNNMGAVSNVVGAMGGVGNAMKVAKMFM